VERASLHVERKQELEEHSSCGNILLLPQPVTTSGLGRDTDSLNDTTELSIETLHT
jgi:hypothetical protein